MATIVIRDLAQSVELDRQAMLAISGGARSGLRPSFARSPVSPTSRDSFSRLSGLSIRSTIEGGPTMAKTLLK
ncbi:MAG: hypothetical protein WBP72_03040 [Rhodocyclaceae bacterium]